MSVTQPDLSIELALNEAEDGLLFSDNTGAYNITTNPLGYGLPGGPDTDDVTDVTLTLTYGSLESDLVYVFTVVNSVITAATLAFAGGTPANIFSLLPSTTFPFTEFPITYDFGVTIPDFDDDVFKVTYAIEGEVAAEAFTYTAISYLPLGLNTRCCIDKKWMAIEPSCCTTLTDVMYAESLYKQFEIACEFGDMTNALLSLTQAESLCDCDEC